MKKKALIVGCGYVGSYLRKILQQYDWHVVGISRSGNVNCDELKIDVSNSFSLHISSYDVVFYLVSADAYTSAAYEAAYLRGVTNTLQALAKTKQRPRFVFVSSTSLFAEVQGNLVDESSPISTTLFSKQFLNAGEQLVWKSGLTSIVVRFSGIYGPGRSRLVQQVKDGTAYLKKMPCISNRIHLEDCAGILYHVATTENPFPLYIGSDSEPTPYNEVLIWLANRLGLPAPKTEAASKISTHLSNKRCSNNLLIDSGYCFRFPNFREGLRTCL